MELLLATAALTAIALVLTMTRFVPEGEALVIERMGHYKRTLMPGFHLVMPLFEHCVERVSLREDALELPPFLCITSDNAHLIVDCLVIYKVIDPARAHYAIEDLSLALRQLAYSFTNDQIRMIELCEIYKSRVSISDTIRDLLANRVTEWGLAISRYELMDIKPSELTIRAMERKLINEYEKKAVTLESEGARIARVNLSLAEREEVVQSGLGEKARLTYEAEGRAKALEVLSSANAECVGIIASALAIPGSGEAARLELARDYIAKLTAILSEAQTVVLPESTSKNTEINDKIQEVGEKE